MLAAVKRAIAVGAAAGALLSGGCYGMTRLTDEPTPDADVVVAVDADPDEVVTVDADPDEVVTVDADPDEVVTVDADLLPPLSSCEPEYRLSGDMAPTGYFTCPGDDPPAAREELPIYIGDGHVCDGATAYAWFTLLEDARVRLALLDGGNSVTVTLLDEAGRPVARIGPGSACVEAEMPAGPVGLAADQVEPWEGAAYFEFYLDFAEDEAP